MKLLTLNTHSWQEEDQLNKIKYLAKVIVENGYDVIALQEVSQHMLGKQFKEDIKLDNYAVVLNEEIQKLGCHQYELLWDFAHIGFEVYEEGLCLLSKLSMVEKKSFFVSQTQDTLNWKARKIVKATIDYKGTWIDFYSCHLGWWHDLDEPAKKQIDALQAHLNPTRQSFIMGDFNNDAHVVGEGYDYIKELGWRDTYESALEKDGGDTVRGKIDGWLENNENRRLDYIFATHPITVKSSKVIFNGKNKQIISDHCGVEVEIEL